MYSTNILMLHDRYMRNLLEYHDILPGWGGVHE